MVDRVGLGLSRTELSRATPVIARLILAAPLKLNLHFQL